MTGNGVEIDRKQAGNRHETGRKRGKIDRKKTGNRQGMGRNRPETGRKGVETERKQAENG